MTRRRTSLAVYVWAAVAGLVWIVVAIFGYRSSEAPPAFVPVPPARRTPLIDPITGSPIGTSLSNLILNREMSGLPISPEQSSGWMDGYAAGVKMRDGKLAKPNSQEELDLIVGKLHSDKSDTYKVAFREGVLAGLMPAPPLHTLPKGQPVPEIN